MRMRSFLCVYLCITFVSLKAGVFTKVDSVQLQNASVWGVISDDGDSLCATTIYSPSGKAHIFMRKINYNNIIQQSSLVQLTVDSDFVSINNLTDHKSIILNNEIYVTFSTAGDQDLYIFKTDINGKRIGNIVTVVEGSSDPTNDMILTTDGTYIFVMHFDPPGQHHVYKYDNNLNLVGNSFSTTTLNHNNIGNAIFINNEFYMFTGSTFGHNSNLILTKWDNSWNPTISVPQTLMSSSGGDGNFFPDGVIYDNLSQRWYIAMNHIYSGENIGQEHIDLLAFDNNFNLLERLHVTTTDRTRPHMVLKNGSLYLSYDQPANNVYLLKYQVENTTSVAAETHNDDLLIYPNPVLSEFHLDLSANDTPADFTLSNIYGQTIAYYHFDKGTTSANINIENQLAGVYFLQSSGGQQVYKIVKQ